MIPPESVENKAVTPRRCPKCGGPAHQSRAVDKIDPALINIVIQCNRCGESRHREPAVEAKG